MEDRIYSLETEYAIAHHTDDPNLVLGKSEIFNLLDTALVKKYNTQRGFSEKSGPVEFKEGRFIENGARFYFDAGHAEWAAPECRNAADAVIFDKAGERVLEDLISEANTLMKQRGYKGSLMIIKNNVDSTGTTYGCHENYLFRRANDLSVKNDTLNFLVTFLVTRQVFCGAGKVGTADDMVSAGNPVIYQVSQRADFIYYETSDFTVREPDTRGIVDLRDEPLADKDKYRRLHIILGDSNMSEYTNFLKLGTTGIVLQMIEDQCIDPTLELVDPISTIKEISHDPSCQVKIPLKNEKLFTAANIQRRYLEMARKYLSPAKINEETQLILDMWEEVLEALQEDPMLLATKIDWVIKKELLNRYIAGQKSNWDEVRDWNYAIAKTKNVLKGRHKGADIDMNSFIKEKLPKQYGKIQDYMRIKNLDWKDYFRQLKIYYEIRERDIRYHDITREGLYNVLFKSKLVDSLFYWEDIRKGKYHPPYNTRAKIRGDLINKACKQGLKIAVDWDRVKREDSERVFQLNDPFASTKSNLWSFLKK